MIYGSLKSFRTNNQKKQNAATQRGLAWQIGGIIITQPIKRDQNSILLYFKFFLSFSALNIPTYLLLTTGNIIEMIKKSVRSIISMVNNQQNFTKEIVL